MPEQQTIPARHGVATFVPSGSVIKIINTSGSQVIDTWAFALPKPEEKKAEGAPKDEKTEQKEDSTKDESKKEEPKEEDKSDDKPKPTPKKKKGSNDLPSQEEAEKATREGIAKGEEASKEATPKKNTWSSYVPSIGWSGKKDGEKQPPKDQTQQQKDSKTWSSYFPSGQGFSNYIPKTASNTVTSFTSSHKRDTNKSYVEQLQDFSKTPVGAAGIKGMAAFSGSGYGGSLYAGYQAYNATHASDVPNMEFMSMAHSRAATLHMRPKVNDTLVSNLREPILTLVEDSSSGVHDTLIAACDPARYRGLGAEKWEEHGSCAENLVLALKELNERAGLKGAKGVGADVTINNVPAPLNLFMNIPWDEEGDLGFKAPKSKEGDYVRLKAERDVVVVMSACPQDILEINNKKPTDANFVVEDSEDTAEAVKRSAPKKRPAPRKINSSSKPPSTVATGDLGDDDKSRVGSTPTAKKPPVKKAPAKKPAAAGQTSQAKAGATAAPKKKPIPRPAGTPAKAPASGDTKAPASGDKPANGTPTAPAEKKKPRKLNKPAE